VIVADLADKLDAVKRLGEATDEPEGSRYIIMSDTLARQISETLRRCVVVVPLESPH
jgi:hypothetical protein